MNKRCDNLDIKKLEEHDIELVNINLNNLTNSIKKFDILLSKINKIEDDAEILNNKFITLEIDKTKNAEMIKNEII